MWVDLRGLRGGQAEAHEGVGGDGDWIAQRLREWEDPPAQCFTPFERTHCQVGAAQDHGYLGDTLALAGCRFSLGEVG